MNIIKKASRVINNSGVSAENQKSVDYLIERVIYFRNRAGMSASELSGRIGQSASYINKFESAGFNIPCSVILKICEVCEVEPAEFFSIDYRNYHKNKQLSELIGKMPISEREKLLDFLITIHPKNKI